ncbi:polysaccharide biosynthesis C-terminal domain-containing protein [Mariniblastus fucicola]|uniref:NAD dependent epimerase/dehydratase family protein n=1 Tax=Mariniblastus fucicola TaxID=980251 RepID=A0A5B9P7N3_9BACT|nr:NAD-dependent epimerase/dehydratase family protein [Mariniblastus fucicola]QEG22338.1 NAD dependent epimerase/dehydratase family protein [Mariniblastus fucicola]
MTRNSQQHILVTGSDGLIGWHLRCWLETCAGTHVIPCNREQFNDDAYLSDAIEKANVIVHLAGMNRGEEEDIVQTNIGLAQRITEICQQLDCRPQIIYSSSTQVDGDSRYGYSKRVAGETFQDWANVEDARFLNLVLPHVFGEHGKPFYNSVVSTFAHQLANGETPKIISDGQVNLLHAHDVAQIIWNSIEDGTVGELRPHGSEMFVSELLERMQRLSQRYFDGVIPEATEPIDLKLFNTFRSYIPYEKRAVDLTLHTDDRGNLFEAARADGQGQVFVSTSHPGITRGQHFHFRKVERFLVIQGKAKIRMRRVLHDDIVTYEVSGDHPQAIDIPTLHTHNITNVGDTPLLTLFWAGEHFDPDNSDTYPMIVEIPTTQSAEA